MPKNGGLILAVVLMAIFVIPTSISGTAVALPSIARDMQANIASLQWIVTAFNLTFACFTLAWGAAADVIGHKKTFMAGALVYLAASIASALSPSVAFMDIARALCGIGAAAVFAAGSAILSHTFEGSARVKAFAMAGAVIGVGVGIGPTMSGFLVDNLGWRAIFVLHTVVIAISLGLLLKVDVPFHRQPGKRVDWLGTVLFVGSALLVVTGIIQGSQWGWADTRTLGAFIAGALGFVLLIAVEQRVKHPIIDLGILSEKVYLGWCLATVAPSFGFFTMLTYLPSYFMFTGNHSAQFSGNMMLLLALPLFVAPVIAGKLVEKGAPARRVLIAGLIVLLAGGAAMHLVDRHSSLLVFAIPMLMVGFGTGVTAGLADGQALASVPPQHAGTAAGFLNTFRLGSETLAIASYGAMLTTSLKLVMAPQLTAHGVSVAHQATQINAVASGQISALPQVTSLPSDFFSQSYDDAFHAVVWLLVAICAVVCLFVWRLLRTRNP